MAPGMSTPLLALAGVTNSPLGTALLALGAMAALVFIGRLLLSIAWKLVAAATVVVAGLWVVSVLL
ncbi:uncharacterized protein OE_3330F [Halobacterium salinarum R1]|nr:uncharacterized protein OE_3330F [Halobacterium salinarum R1]